MKTFHILDGDIIKGVNFNDALNYLEKGVDVFDSTNKKATKKEILKSKKEMDSMMFPPIPQVVVKESED